MTEATCGSSPVLTDIRLSGLRQALLREQRLAEDANIRANSAEPA
jgi:hypothetical protein